MRIGAPKPVVRALLACAIFLLSLGLVSGALAQTIPVPSTNYSGTIASTGTFQLIQGQANGRIGCTVQNNGTHTMYVFFGPPANATTATAAQLSAGQSLNCGIGANIVAKDSVSITGTSGDAFFANFQ
jgi:hypothetical protein